MDNPFEIIYSKKVMNHFLHPKNVGVIKNPDGEATVGNPVCGDVMKFYIKVEKKGKEEYLKDIKFQTLGCGAAIATSSIMTVLVKGKPLKDAVKIGKKAIIEALGGLPPAKVHCSVLADTALKKAIIDYRKKKAV
jgi:NifU-like protein involved in Fe-S cluster formation